jgi:hypothetical protein
LAGDERSREHAVLFGVLAYPCALGYVVKKTLHYVMVFCEIGASQRKGRAASQDPEI